MKARAKLAMLKIVDKRSRYAESENQWNILNIFKNNYFTLDTSNAREGIVPVACLDINNKSSEGPVTVTCLYHDAITSSVLT